MPHPIELQQLQPVPPHLETTHAGQLDNDGAQQCQEACPDKEQEPLTRSEFATDLTVFLTRRDPDP